MNQSFSFREFMIRHDLNEYQIANLFGVHRTTVKNWERGKTMPEVIARFCRILDNNPHLIVEMNPNMRSNLPRGLRNG